MIQSYAPPSEVKPAALPVILVIEDHEITNRALSLALKARGFESQACINGQQALDHLKKSIPAAALVDVHLPDTSGLELTRKLRAIVGEDMPIIVMSGDTSMTTLTALPHVGATYFVSKPINIKHLMERLAEWIPQSVAQPKV